MPSKSALGRVPTEIKRQKGSDLVDFNVGPFVAARNVSTSLPIQTEVMVNGRLQEATMSRSVIKFFDYNYNIPLVYILGNV